MQRQRDHKASSIGTLRCPLPEGSPGISLSLSPHRNIKPSRMAIHISLFPLPKYFQIIHNRLKEMLAGYLGEVWRTLLHAGHKSHLITAQHFQHTTCLNRSDRARRRSAAFQCSELNCAAKDRTGNRVDSLHTCHVVIKRKIVAEKHHDIGIYGNMYSFC